MIGKTMADFRKESEESAKSSVKMRLVLEAIYKDAGLKVEDSEIDSKVKELAEAYARKEDELKANEELMTNIKNSLETEKTINYLVENAKVSKAAAKKEEKAPKVEKESKEVKADKETKTTKAKAEKADKEEKEEKKTTTKKSGK
jgi:FKBP-type peptidyl-prolyl cis-trans isomerase (trigger factor)